MHCQHQKIKTNQLAQIIAKLKLPCNILGFLYKQNMNFTPVTCICSNLDEVFVKPFNKFPVNEILKPYGDW